MRAVGRQIAEEGLLLVAAAVDPVERRAEEHVGAVALGPHELTVAADRGIEIGVARGVAAAAGKALPDPAAAVDEDPVESPLPGLIRVLVAQVPFAEDARRVAGRTPEQLRQRDRGLREPLPLEDRMADAGAELVPTGQERRPRGGAGGADVKLGEPHRLLAKPIEVRRLDHPVAVGGDVAVALVVGHHVDDVGPAAGERPSRPLGPRWDCRRGRRRGRPRLGRGEAAALRGDPVPLPLEPGHAVGLGRRQIVRLAAVGREVVELPGLAAGRDELPVAHPHRAMPVMAPPERLVGRRRGGSGECPDKTPPVQRWRGLGLLFGHSCEFEHGRHQVDRMHGLAAEFASGGDPLGPMDDPGGGDAPFVGPDLVPAKGRVGSGGPARPEAQKRLP